MTRLRFFIIIVSLSLLIFFTNILPETRIDSDAKLSSSPLYDAPAQIEPSGTSTPELVHIVNLYSPMDDTQNLVVESMRRAKESMKYCNNSDDLRLDVKLMAAVHPKDLDIVPTVFDSYGVLKRLYNGRFPLIQEIIDLALTGHVHMSHLMYTNADIVLHPNFYCEAKTLLQLRT